MYDFYCYRKKNEGGICEPIVLLSHLHAKNYLHSSSLPGASSIAERR